MVAGASTIDFVLMVIAADEGVMPPTVEHLKILSLLEVKRGIIALTKIDMVDQEWLELVIADVREAVSGTFLEDAPLIPVSSYTGEGFEKLVEEITHLAQQVEREKPTEFFRMPIDRVFTIPGHGTVITGTLLGGKVNKGDNVQIMPEGKIVRVRGIQVHGEQVETAVAGDRCALNLAGIQTEEIERGDLVVLPNTLEPTSILDASIIVVDDTAPLVHGQRVRIHIGTTEVMGKIRLIGRDTLEEGERGFIQLRPEKPIVAARGDRFILRFYSPMRVIAGGTVLNHRVPNRSRFAQKTIDIFEIEAKGEPEELLVLAFTGHPLTIEQLSQLTFLPRNSVAEALQHLQAAGVVTYFESIGKWFLTEAYQKLAAAVIELLKKYYNDYPYREGVEREEVRNKLFATWELKDFNAFINAMVRDSLIGQQNSIIYDLHRAGNSDLLIDQKLRDILEIYQNAETIPPSLNRLAEKLNLPEAELIDRLDFLCRKGYLAGINKDALFYRETLERVKAEVKKVLDNEGELTVASFRDRINSNRQYTIAILEYLDSIGFTMRKGNVRIKGPRFSLIN